jgi:hypothetical protein
LPLTILGSRYGVYLQKVYGGQTMPRRISLLAGAVYEAYYLQRYDYGSDYDDGYLRALAEVLLHSPDLVVGDLRGGAFPVKPEREVLRLDSLNLAAELLPNHHDLAANQINLVKLNRVYQSGYYYQHYYHRDPNPNSDFGPG